MSASRPVPTTEIITKGGRCIINESDWENWKAKGAKRADAPSEPPKPDWSDLNVPALKALADAAEVKNFAELKRDELIAALEEKGLKPPEKNNGGK